MAKMSYGELLEPYSFRRDFDYWKHLETRSHFDVMSDRIDQSILKLGLSQAEIAELTTTRIGEQMRDLAGSISAGQDRVVDELRSGFRDMGAGLDRVADSVDRVRDSVDDVRFAVENGFRLTERRLASLEHVLSDLLEAVRSPERTWALEQYATARDLYRREYYGDALQYLDLAINGKGSNNGYRFDAQFHLLRGTILLGDRENLDRTLIDPRAAKAAFEEAVKYAKPPREMLDATDAAGRADLLQLRCFARCCSGWASYVMGDMAEAERCYRAAVEDCPDDARANYHLGKVLAHLGRHEEAAQYVAKAIRRNFFLIAQLASDADFRKDAARYRREVETYRTQLLDGLGPVSEALLLAVSEKRGFALDRSGNALSVLPDSQFTGQPGDLGVDPDVVEAAGMTLSRSVEIGAAVRLVPRITSEASRLLGTLEQNDRSFAERLGVLEDTHGKMQTPTHSNMSHDSSAVQKFKTTQQMIGYGAAALSLGGWIFIDGFTVLPFLLSLGYAFFGAPLVGGMYEGTLKSDSLRRATATFQATRKDLAGEVKKAERELDSLRSLRSRLFGALTASSFQKLLEEASATSIEGRVFEGVVTNLHPWGVMVRFKGNKDGLVHVSQLSKSSIRDPSEVTAIGRKVRVFVRGVDDRGKVMLSMNFLDQPNVNAERGNNDAKERPDNNPPLQAPGWICPTCRGKRTVTVQQGFFTVQRPCPTCLLGEGT